MSIYTDNGFANRREYFDSLSREFEIGTDMISTFADLLGPDEDFDGLVSQIQEYVFANADVLPDADEDIMFEPMRWEY